VLEGRIVKWIDCLSLRGVDLVGECCRVWKDSIRDVRSALGAGSGVVIWVLIGDHLRRNDV